MTQFEYLVLVHVVNIKLDSFDNWKALGWTACTAVAALVNSLHKPNKNWKDDNGKDPGEYSSSCGPFIEMEITIFEKLCYTSTKIRQFSLSYVPIGMYPLVLIPSNKGNNGTY